jgi:hypothetical protein
VLVVPGVLLAQREQPAQSLKGLMENQAVAVDSYW